MAYSYRTFRFGGMLTPVVKRLMIANVVVFLLTLVMNQAVGPQFMIDWFAFQPTRIFLRPWGVFTYMFIHGGFWHIAMNMLVLFFFGPPLEAAWGGREFFRYYVICGLGGVALSYVFLPTAIIGASAAIYGLMLAFALSWPDSPIYIWGIFPIKAKWLVGFLFLLTLFNALSAPGAGIAYFAHLGGFLTGFLYLKSDWHGARGFERLKKAVRTHPRLAIVPHHAKRQERQSSVKHEVPETRTQKEEVALYDAVDQVLDKISEHGIGSLTAAERKLLDDVSRKHRTN